GKSTKAIAITTGLNDGELIIAATASRVLVPPLNKPCPTGVAQFAHTPSGAPTTAPQNTFAAAYRNRFRRSIAATNCTIAAPKGSAKYMPKRFVHSQFTAVRTTRTGNGIAGFTGNRASNEITPLIWIARPVCSFFNSDG